MVLGRKEKSEVRRMSAGRQGVLPAADPCYGDDFDSFCTTQPDLLIIRRTATAHRLGLRDRDPVSFMGVWQLEIRTRNTVTHHDTTVVCGISVCVRCYHAHRSGL